MIFCLAYFIKAEKPYSTRQTKPLADFSPSYRIFIRQKLSVLSTSQVGPVSA